MVLLLLRARLAANLRRMRRVRGWTQLRAATAAGLDLRHYQKIEAGDVGITLDTLEALAEALGVAAGDLLAE